MRPYIIQTRTIRRARSRCNSAQSVEVTAYFKLFTTTGLTVHVHCTHTRGVSVLISLLKDGVAGVDSYEREVWMFGDDQIVAGVLPGHYTVLVAGQNWNTSSARKAIDVG